MPNPAGSEAIENERIETTLDVTGLPCPVPVLKAQKALRALSPGAILEVLADDPASDADMRALCLALGHRLVSSGPATAEAASGAAAFRFLIRKT